jgi:hypothetical protein
VQNRTLWRSLLALPLACAVAVGLNCGSCSQRAATAQEPPTGLLTLASAQATGALWVANLEDHMHDLAQFTAALLTDPAQAATVQRGRATLVKSLGFDPFAPGGFASVGIKAQQGLLVFGEGALRTPLLALGVSDAARLNSYLIGLVGRLDGAQEHTTATQAGFTVHSVSRPFGKSRVVSLHWAQVRGYVLLATGGDAAGLQRALTRLQAEGAALATAPLSPTPAPSAATAPLLGSPLYDETLRHLAAAHRIPPSSGSVHLYARLEGKATDSRARSVAATLQIDRRGLAVQSFLGAPLPKLYAALQQHSGDANNTLALSKQLSDRAVTLLLSRAALPETVQELLRHPSLSPMLLQATAYVTRLTGVDLERDSAPQLTGDLSAALYMPSPQALMAARSVQQLHAGGGLQAEAVVGIADPDRLRTVLRAAQAILDPGPGAQVRPDANRGAQATIGMKHTAKPRLDPEHAAQAPLDAKRAAVLTTQHTFSGQSATLFFPQAADSAQGTEAWEGRPLGWAVLGHHYAYAAGSGRLRPLLQRLADGQASTLAQSLHSSVVRSSLEGPGALLALGIARLGVVGAQLRAADTAPASPASLVQSGAKVLERLGDVVFSWRLAEAGVYMGIAQELP